MTSTENAARKVVKALGEMGMFEVSGPVIDAYEELVRALDWDEKRRSQTLADAQRWGEPYGLEAGKLQWAWRCGERDDEAELEAAICDALQMGGIYGWPGDGVSCAAQIAQHWLRRAKKAEAALAALSDGALGRQDETAMRFREAKRSEGMTKD